MRRQTMQHLLLFLLPAWSLWFLVILPSRACAFSWPRRMTELSNGRPAKDAASSQHPVANTKPASDLSKVYGVALHELEKLESEPLCHRIASRLLIHNCQILDGKDEATVLTDTGRAARDFVDGYAVSLAICDLQRGSFEIPRSCDKFQEATLSQLSVPKTPTLHVSTAEINACLAGLATLDSAWNTWVSYRDKALSFCMAARVENEKDRNIFLYRKLTQILERLTTEVDLELEIRFASFNQAILNTSENLGGLDPKINQLIRDIKDLERVLFDQIHGKSKEVSRSVENSAESARSLQSLLLSLVRSTMENNAELVAAQRSAVQTGVNQVQMEMAGLVTTLATVALSSASLQRDMEHSQKQMDNLSKQQSSLQTGMRGLVELADELSRNHKEHQETLKSAQENADNVLSTILTISHSAASLESTVVSWFNWNGWWPHILCPTVSLVLGSYGLPPSVGRNILLVGLGEFVGLTISAFHETAYFSFYQFTTDLNNSSATTTDTDQ